MKRFKKKKRKKPIYLDKQTTLVFEYSSQEATDKLLRELEKRTSVVWPGKARPTKVRPFKGECVIFNYDAGRQFQLVRGPGTNGRLTHTIFCTDIDTFVESVRRIKPKVQTR